MLVTYGVYCSVSTGLLALGRAKTRISAGRDTVGHSVTTWLS